jgi:PEP-CTERM motif
MKKTSVGAACGAVLVALTGGLMTPTATHAAVYGGVFDPSNTFYQWSGTHRFEVSDACLQGADGWRLVNAYEGGCGTARLTDGSLTVVNKRGTYDLSDDVSRTLQFSDFEFIPTSTDPFGPDVWGVYVVGGEAVGFDTREIGGFEFVDDPYTHGGTWYLTWTTGLAPNGYCFYFGCGARPESAGMPMANGRSTGVGSVSLTNFVGNTINGNVPPRTLIAPTFVRLDPTNAVPEPTTVTLVLAALGAGWLTRRRNRR